MSEVADIQRQLDELDREFNSEENVRRGFMTRELWARKHGELRVRLHVAERAVAEAPQRVQHRSTSPWDATQAARLKAIEQRLTEARKAHDVETLAAAVSKDSEYLALRSADHRHKVDSLMADAFDKGAPLDATKGLIKAVFVSLLEVNKDRVNELGVITAGVISLKERIAALEARPTMKYCGVWSADDQYRENQFVTDRGSLWACRETTRSRPGTDETWQLAAKRGADGKDVRQ